MKKDWLLCVGQKAFINEDGKVLILTDPIDGLDFPGGKIQEGETDFESALKREVKEETGLEIKVGPPFHVWYHEFFPPHRNAGKKVYLIGFSCDYASGEVKLSSEHSEYHWVSKDDYKKFNDGSEYFKALEKYFSSVLKS